MSDGVGLNGRGLNGRGLNGRGLNGRGLNGRGLNGRGLNGRGLNGQSLGTMLTWASFRGVTVEGVRLDHTELHASVFSGSARFERHTERQFSGTDFDGATFSGRSDTGKLLHLRIAEIDPPQGNGDIWRYWVEYRLTDHDWAPLCADQNNSYPAIPINGWWDPRQGVPGGGSKLTDPGRFTFACERVGAIGKCIDFGYEPWASVDGVSLDAYHQSCVRLIRADYCGDGTSYTTNGKLVDLYDDLGVQVDTEDWNLEAEWNPDGARCLNAATAQVHDALCYAGLVTADCGDSAHFGDGTLLISERP